MGLLGALLGALLLCLPAGGVQYINDELLWTKQSWEDYKLSFPWQFFGKREPAVRGLLDGEPWERTSLAGPLGNIQAEIEKDLRRWVAAKAGDRTRSPCKALPPLPASPPAPARAVSASSLPCALPSPPAAEWTCSPAASTCPSWMRAPRSTRRRAWRSARCALGSGLGTLQRSGVDGCVIEHSSGALGCAGLHGAGVGAVAGADGVGQRARDGALKEAHHRVRRAALRIRGAAPWCLYS